MYIDHLTQDRIELFGGIAVLAGLFFGLLRLLVYFDKRGFNTHLGGKRTKSKITTAKKKASSKTKHRRS